MRVVNISLSPSVLDRDSVTAGRIAEYGRLITEYIVIVPYHIDTELHLNENVIVYGVGGNNKIFKLIRIYKKVRELIDAGRCDVIATDPYFFGLLGVFVSKRFGIGFESIALGFEKFTWLRKQVANFVLKRAGSIRVNSPRLVRFVRDEFGISGEKVHMVPIYVDVESIGLRGERSEEEQKEYEKHVGDFNNLYKDNFNFLCVNRLVPAKNISLQLRAIAQLKETHPEVFLHVLGDGQLEEELAKEIKKLGIESNALLHGYTDGMKLGAIYTSCNCFLLTSTNEGWGMVTVEALTAKLPVIMTDTGSAGEVIIDGESGMVIPVNDEDALVGAMKVMMEDEHHRNKLIAGGEHALQSLHTLPELLVLYKESWEYTLKN